MKKTIVLALAAIISLSAFSQKLQDPIKPKADSIVKAPTDTVIIDLTKHRFVKIVGDMDDHGKQIVHDAFQEVPVWAVPQWIVGAYDYMENSSGGLSKAQVTQMQWPLLKYRVRYQRALEQQAPKQ